MNAGAIRSTFSQKEIFYEVLQDKIFGIGSCVCNGVYLRTSMFLCR
jgi:hypothetical protein